MIIVKLMGGLGNQMFQYAAAKSLSLKHKTNIKIDLSFLETDPKGQYTKRSFELDIFKFTPAFSTASEIESFMKYTESKPWRVAQRMFPKLFKKNYFVESGVGYHKAIENTSSDTYLSGFWQTEKYFSNFEKQIREDFLFKNPLVGLNLELEQKIAASNSLSIHVRRGDYVSNTQANQFHGVCSVDYYLSAIKYILGKKNIDALFVFSDEPDWCRENLKFDLPTTYISHNKGKESYIDMQLMSRCKHNIIANSSFSWWGAWLNSNQDKIVVAPKNWFNDLTMQSKDIYPDSWHTL